MFPPVPSRRLLLAALLAGGAPAAARAAPAETLHVHYGVSLIGLPIGTALVTGELEPTSYKVEANAKLTGLASILSSSKGAATAAGVISGNRPVGTSYATTSSNATMTRTVRMAMSGGSVAGVDIEPPFDPQIPRVPITEADRRGIIDPLSAFVIGVPPGASPTGAEACDRTLPIFDGGTRFDITLSFVATRHVKSRGYLGDVAVCSARYKPISGHRLNGKAAQFMADNKSLEVWLAPVAGTHYVFPYRISVLTQIGTVVIEADEFTVDGSTHASNATP